MKRFFFVLLILAGIAVLTFLGRQKAPSMSARSAPRLIETQMTNLVMIDGHWRRRGKTNVFTGILLNNYDNGALKSRSVVSNGLLHGLSIGWHTNGQQQIEEHYVAGISHGLRTKWHPNGAKHSEGAMVRGKLQGAFHRWHDDGSVAEVIEMEAGQPNGLSLAYYPSGFLKARARLAQGKVIEQTFWKDGEVRSPQ
jgi:antitoxin component YwqK of YwqJK toxin-antitoxin module